MRQCRGESHASIRRLVVAAQFPGEGTEARHQPVPIPCMRTQISASPLARAFLSDPSSGAKYVPPGGDYAGKLTDTNGLAGPSHRREVSGRGRTCNNANNNG